MDFMSLAVIGCGIYGLCVLYMFFFRHADFQRGLDRHHEMQMAKQRGRQARAGIIGSLLGGVIRVFFGILMRKKH